jgi:hypothetical protein
MSAPRVLRALVGTTMFLCLLSVAVNVAFRIADGDHERTLREFFDVDKEQSLPTWFSVMEIELAALIAFVIGAAQSEHARRYRRRWVLLGVILTALSIDELASLHEPSTAYVKKFIQSDAIAHAWVVPGIALAAIVGIAYLPFPAHFRSGFGGSCCSRRSPTCSRSRDSSWSRAL